MSGRPASGWRSLFRFALGASIAGGAAVAAFLTFAVVAFAEPPLAWTASIWLWPAVAAGAALVLAILFLAAAALVGEPADGAERSGRRASIAALLVGAVVLFYLLLVWWRGASTGRGSGSGLYLVCAAGIAWLIAWLCLRLCRRESVERGAVLMVPTLGLFLALSVLAFVVRVSSPQAARGSFAPPFEVGTPAGRLLFLGVDGLDAGLIQDFASRGAVARLLDGMRGGATFPLHRAEAHGPAEVWSSVLTGVAAARKRGETSAAVAPIPRIATSSRDAARPTPAEAARRFLFAAGRAFDPGDTPGPLRLWEIVALRESTVAIGWPGTWPALPTGEDSNSMVISEVLLPSLIAGVEPDRAVWPETRLAGLITSFAPDRAALAEEFAALFPVAEGTVIRQWLWESYLIDGYRWHLARRYGTGADASSVFVHFPGLDLLRTRLDAHGAERELHTLLEISEALELYVKWLDALLGEALQAPAGWVVALAGDPGGSTGAGTEGFLVVRGGPARPGCVGTSLALVDVAPLALNLLGFPSSQEMSGKIPEHCMAARLVPPDPVSTYGRRSGYERPAGQDNGTAMNERLRSLGYLD